MSSERRATSGELKAASQTEPAAKRRKRIGAKRAPEGRKKHNQEKTKELRLPIDEKCRIVSECTFILHSDFFLPHFYFCVGGAVGCGAGVTGAVLAGCDFKPCSTEFELPRRDVYTDNVTEVIMKKMADHVVARSSALAAPRGPNAVWLPWPPNAAEMSPLLPLCSSTTRMMKKQTMM